MKKALIFTMVVALCCSMTARAELRKENITVHKLDNGLKILLLEQHAIPNIAFYTFFRVGSRNERVGLTGVSHFIEHMMFNGTNKVGPGQFDRIMEFNGGANNAFTGQDFTGYTNWYPSAALEKMVEMEADRIQGLIFDPTVLESERQVVASERRMAVENSNEGLLDEATAATAMMAHPYHWSVIGWMSDILSWPRAEIMAYYHTYYSPNNAVVVVVGDFSSPKLLELLKKYYAAIPRGPEPPQVRTIEPPQSGPRRLVISKEAQSPILSLMYHTPAVTAADFPALKVLENILLEGDSSRLYKRLVSETQLAVAVNGGISETFDPYLFGIQVQPNNNADLDRIEKIIETELDAIIGQGVSGRELEKAKNIIQTRFYTRLQTIAGKASQIGSMEMLYGDYAYLFKLMDAYTPITSQTVQAAAKKYFYAANKTVGTLLAQGGDK